MPYRQDLTYHLFTTAADIEAAVRALNDAGFSTENISILIPDPNRRADSGGGELSLLEDPDVIMSQEHAGIEGLDVGSTAVGVPGQWIAIGGPLAVRLAQLGQADLDNSLVEALGIVGLTGQEAEDALARFHQGEMLVIVTGERCEDAAALLDDPSRWAYRGDLRPTGGDAVGA